MFSTLGTPVGRLNKNVPAAGAFLPRLCGKDVGENVAGVPGHAHASRGDYSVGQRRRYKRKERVAAACISNFVDVAWIFQFCVVKLRVAVEIFKHRSFFQHSFIFIRRQAAGFVS